MALTLLHTADWHLGRRFPAFEREQEQQLTRARLDAVVRILDLAESRNVDAVLCAGDLFDDPAPEEPWWGGVLREFGTEIDPGREVRVHDSTADMRYLVLPMQPEGTEGWPEEKLAGIVTRDTMVGTAEVRPAE